MAIRKSSSEGSATNNAVDYVLVYNFSSLGIYSPISLLLDPPPLLDKAHQSFFYTDKETASTRFEKLITALSKVGIESEVRNGNEGTVLVLARASNEKVLGTVVYRSRWDLTFR